MRRDDRESVRPAKPTTPPNVPPPPPPPGPCPHVFVGLLPACVRCGESLEALILKKRGIL